MPDSAAGWEVPCKHIVAAFYLAEAFDDDPFTIPAWRGREREDRLASLTLSAAMARPSLTARDGLAGRSPTALSRTSQCGVTSL
jgi:uncharacterized Zn finger protein